MRVAIVGGGVTGLAAAYALELEKDSEPVQVTLLEASPRLGGKIQTDRIGNVVIETGPDALFLRSPFALEVIEQLGLAGEVVRANPLHREATILRNGRLHPLPRGMEAGIPRSIWPMAATQLLSISGKLRGTLEMALPRGDVDADESIDSFVRRRFGAEIAERIAAPLLGGIYSSDIRDVSLRATVPHLRTWEQEHGSLLLASLRGRLRGARSSNGASPFISLRTGLDTLVGSLRDHCRRTEIRLGAQVNALAPAADGGGFTLTVAGAQRIHADRVILTAPAFVNADLVEPLSPAAAAALRSIRYASATVVAFVFSPASCARVPHGSGFLVAPDERSLLKACSWSSQKWPHCAPGGDLLVRCHLREHAQTAEDAILIRSVLDELRQLVRMQAVPEFARVYRWPRSIPSYSIGHLERIHAIEAALNEFPGLVIAGAGFTGVGVPECLRQGMAAADAVRRAHVNHSPVRVVATRAR